MNTPFFPPPLLCRHPLYVYIFTVPCSLPHALSRTRTCSLSLSLWPPPPKTPTQHFLSAQLEAELGEAGFCDVKVTKCSYPMSTEFVDPPKWMEKEWISLPWDWIAVARKWD